MKYIVNVVRISYANQEIEVEADSPEQAKDIALDHAGSYFFTEKTADYEADSAWLKEENN